MDYRKESLRLHGEWKGKVEVVARAKVDNKDALSLAYTPGVAEPCLAIQADYNKSWELTRRWNMVAVITDGSAVLGLGDIGPEAGMPVMEGKCVLFKEFGGVDAFPLCVRTKDVDEFVETVYNISGSFGGINLEDIAAPRCFEIEQKLKERCDIPIFHDDQHGTAVVVSAALINATKITGKPLDQCKAVINGSGAAGIAIAKLLLTLGLGDVILCDRTGAIYEGRDKLNASKAEIAAVSNKGKVQGTLAEAVKGTDIFIGVSAPGVLTQEMIRTMNPDPIVLAMANPTPEILPEEAAAAGAKIVGTGRSDFPNQINNVVAFPGIFRGALDVRAAAITENMKIAAAYAIASLVSDAELKPEYILPHAFDPRISLMIMACMLLLAACDNYLDIQPTGSVIPNSLAEYRALLARSYKDVSKFSDRGMACFRSDEMQVRDNEYDQNYYMDIERWNDLAPNAYTSSFEWAKYYNVLFIANHVIESRSDIKEGTEEEINQLVGEAYMLRAYVHFLLVNLYGQPYTKEGALDTKSVPLKLDTDLEKVLKRNTVEEVYTSIQADIDEARKLVMKAEWEQRYSYRFNAASVEAFQSRVSLYKGEWQAAWDAAEAVLAVKSVLVDLNDAAATLPNSYNSVENITPLETPLSSTINGAALATPVFLSLYAENDLRLDKYFAETDEKGFRKNKKAGSNNYLCTFRVGEIYLTAAEAAARLGELSQARTRLLELMRKRYAPEAYEAKSVVVNAMDKEALVQEILDERARELAFEGHRWFDLRRSTRPRLEKVLDGTRYVLEENDARYTLAIPKEAIEANPGLLN